MASRNYFNAKCIYVIAPRTGLVVADGGKTVTRRDRDIDDQEEIKRRSLHID
jgi:hypothetical protein